MSATELNIAKPSLEKKTSPSSSSKPPTPKSKPPPSTSSSRPTLATRELVAKSPLPESLDPSLVAVKLATCLPEEPSLAKQVPPSVVRQEPPTTDVVKPHEQEIDDQKPLAFSGRAKMGSDLKPSMLLASAAAAIPPSVEDQDFVVLWALSFVVPFFLLRFAFAVTRTFVLSPIRLVIRWTPGGRKLLGFLYIRLSPVAARMTQLVLGHLPGTEYINAVGRATLDKFLVTVSQATASAGPHLLDLAESVKNLHFREALFQTISVLKAWAPMLLLLGPFARNAAVVGRDGVVWFATFSKNAFYVPFGTFLRGAIQRFGQALSENPEVFAERAASLLGPILFLLISSSIVLYVLIPAGGGSDQVVPAAMASALLTEAAGEAAEGVW